MKNIFIALLLLAAVPATAQLEKGTRLAGIQTNLLFNDYYNAGLALSFGSSGHDIGLNIIPTIGWALQRNWLVGAQATFGFESVKNSGLGPGLDYTETYFDLGIAPFTRLYLDLGKNGKLKAFGVAALELIHTNIKKDISQSYTKNTAIASIGGGLAYFGKRTTIDLSMSTSALRLGIYRVIAFRKK
jgi:hypothetical protein